MIVSMFELVRSLLKCCGPDCLKSTQVVYSNDANVIKTKIIEVGGDIGVAPIDTYLVVRGLPNKGSSTADIAYELHRFFNNVTHMFELQEDGANVKYEATFFISNFRDEGVDDKQRSVVSSTLTLKNIRRKR